MSTHHLALRPKLTNTGLLVWVGSGQMNSSQPLKAKAKMGATVGITTLLMWVFLPENSLGSERVASMSASGSNGYGLRISARPGRVTVLASRGTGSASYSAPGRFSGGKIKARWGRRGLISVQFKPSGDVLVTRPERGCIGSDATTHLGVFVGRILFQGEGNFTSARRYKTPGSIRHSNWNCSARRAREEKESDSLRPGVSAIAVRAEKGSRFFGALVSSEPDGIATFVTALRERQGLVRIERRGLSVADPSSYLVSGAKGVVVKPPFPFMGVASFEAGPAGTNVWTGTLSVLLPGSPRIALTGPEFGGGPVGARSLARIVSLLS
jgi:hypothetical protein